MRASGTHTSFLQFCGMSVSLLSLLVMSYALHAQTSCSNGVCPGDNAVYQSSSTNVQSHSSIDASQIAGTGGDVCLAISSALTQLSFNASYYANNAGVIDARGFSNSGTPPHIPCSVNPFANFPLTPSASATILLPAGTIQSHATWTIPHRTRIIGQGACIPVAGSNPTSCSTLTVIEAFTSMTAMVDMGNDAGACPPGQCNHNNFNCNGVGVEHLVLDGLNNATYGIVNSYSEELSYVNDVAMVNLNGTGLYISSTADGDADNSGPYSNLYISTQGACVQIKTETNSQNPMTQTRGIHGLTCKTQLTSGAAVKIDAINNTVEDVSITAGGTGADGIELGANGNASGNVLANITGSNLNNVIHIADPGTSGTCPGGHNVCDVTIAGVSKAGTATHTIEDDLPGLQTSTLNDPDIGLYVVGEPVGNSTNTTGGISRFTTSNSVPTWLVGTSAPNGSLCNTGDLYSNTNGGSSSTLYTCTNGTMGTWTQIASH